MTRLSEHFELREFLRSQTAVRSGRDVIAPPSIVANLERLCELVLEPIRAELGAPVTILSGYRPLWLNRLVGGSPSSEHMDGRAADFEVTGHSDPWVCDRIAALLPRLPINQLILEFPPGGWIHVSVCEPSLQPKREVLTALRRDNRTTYISGIVPQRAA
jgi:zinc D-Ala-D-Ala carboxypeptidase